MINRKYVKEVRKRMEDEFQMNSRLDEYLVKVGAVKSKPKSNLGLKLAIPLVGVLTCCVGVLTTYGIMNGKTAEDLQGQENEYSNIAKKYFIEKEFDKFKIIPGSSYVISKSSNLYVYAAEKNNEIYFISQIVTNKTIKEKVDLHYVNGMDEKRILSKNDSDTSSIEIINDNGFILDDVVINVHVYLDDVFKSTLIVNLINNL